MMRRQFAAVAAILGALTFSACGNSPQETTVVAVKPGETLVASHSTPSQSQATGDPRFLAGDLPLLPIGVDRAVAPLPVMRATYEFAARHPEVMRYVPCFCGCERGGHKDNHDCFVSGRNAGNKVTGWEPHALVCEICVSVAHQALQMHNSGASVSAIRASIEKKYASIADRGNHTPTPMPKKGGASHH